MKASGIIATLLLTIGLGFVAYYTPDAMWHIGWQDLSQIAGSNNLNTISSLLQQLGLIQSTAREEVTAMMTKSTLVIGAFFIAYIFALIGMSGMSKKEKLERKQMKQYYQQYKQ